MALPVNDNPFLNNTNKTQSSVLAPQVPSPSKPNNTESVYYNKDAQSIDPINIGQIHHMNTNDVNDVNDNDAKWDALMQNDPDVDDAKTSRKAFKRHRAHSHLRIIMTGLVIIIMIAIILGSFMYFTKIFDDRTAQEPEPQQSQQQSQSTTHEGAYQDTNNGNNPASASNVSYVGNSTTTTITVDNTNVKLDSETTSSVIEIPSLSEPISKDADCTLANTASTCYIGSVKTGSDKTADLFAFRDASQSSLLMTNYDTTALNVQGSSIAYRTKVQADSKTYDAAIIIAKDQSGIMLVGDADAINAITGGNQIRITSTSK
jgi:hypothetical protein